MVCDVGSIQRQSLSRVEENLIKSRAARMDASKGNCCNGCNHRLYTQGRHSVCVMWYGEHAHTSHGAALQTNKTQSKHQYVLILIIRGRLNQHALLNMHSSQVDNENKAICVCLAYIRQSCLTHCSLACLRSLSLSRSLRPAVCKGIAELWSWLGVCWVGCDRCVQRPGAHVLVSSWDFTTLTKM